ncbi:MAG: long-chain fatty acid--CoA ligase [Myxococcales bacterium]|nr:long-chain fatty acid--CoA ligase [Myxococcales bacterium]
MEFSNLVQLSQVSCDKYASRPLFGTKTGGSWRWTTYRELAEMVAKCRGGLKKLGVGPGDRVAIVADNRLEWVVAAHATYGLGAAFVPMYEVQQPKEWKFILEDCGAKVVFGATSAIDEQLQKIAGELDQLEHVVGIALPKSDARSYEALLAVGADNPAEATDPSSEDVAGLIYTSGTTGNPKGVLLTHGNITSNINALHEIFVFEPEDRSLSFLPWAHSFGQTCELHALMSMGSSLAINDDVKNLVANLADVKPTILYAVPRIFNRIYDGVNKQIADKPGVIQSLFAAGVKNAARKNAGETLGLVEGATLWLADRVIFSSIRQKFGGRLRYAVSGSAALDKAVAEFIDALGIMVYEGYGLTETSPIVTANYPGHRKIGSVGKAIPGVRVHIDESVSDRPGEGEIVVYGPNVMQGYHNREDETRQVLMDDGGFRTGDLGRVDGDGYLAITGRIKEQYKLENGKYVMPAPLEEQLKLSPYIANVLLFGSNKPHNVALVVTDLDAVHRWADENGYKLGELNDSKELHSLIEKEIATRGADFKGFERPKRFTILGEDFTTENGLLTPTLKLKRRNICERYAAELDALYDE